MVLIKDGQPVTDRFRDVSAEEAPAYDGAVIVSMAQWTADADILRDHPAPLGIRLQSHEKPHLIAADLDSFAVIALDFPTFRDGRAYSHARLLRERLGFSGELRAVGDVLLEQLHFMHRVGFNSFAIDSDDALREWEIACRDISVWYQPTADGRETALRLRHGRAAGRSADAA